MILARRDGLPVRALGEVLSDLGTVEVVVDTGGPIGATEESLHFAHVSDEQVAGFEGLMGRIEDFPAITAWSRALSHLERTLEDDEAVWFVEDDVAGGREAFAHLLGITSDVDADLSAWEVRTRDEDPEWYFWSRAEGIFVSPCRAFQPLCRLSARLVRQVLDFRSRHGEFVFHELLFASLASAQGMRTLDWSRACPGVFGEFRFRPEVRPIRAGISHPVKDERVHEAICRYSNTAASPKAACYEAGCCASWYAEDFGLWKRLFVASVPVKILATGVASGVGVSLMLDELFLHPGSAIHAVDLYDGLEGERLLAAFSANVARGGHTGRIRLYEGECREVLAWMIAGEGFWESFDFIHLDGASSGSALLADACQAWSLLRIGGILVLEGGLEREAAIQSFRSVQAERAECLLGGRRVVLIRRE